MAIQYAHARPGYEFRPTPKGTRDYYMEARFDQKPVYKHRLPKRWLSEGWGVERRVELIK